MAQKWCSFVHLIPVFGEWFEKRYGAKCKRHDICCAVQTKNRSNWILIPFATEWCHIVFFFNMCKTGPFDFLIALPVLVLELLFYWIQRVAKWLMGRVPHP